LHDSSPILHDEVKHRNAHNERKQSPRETSENSDHTVGNNRHKRNPEYVPEPQVIRVKGFAIIPLLIAHKDKAFSLTPRAFRTSHAGVTFIPGNVTDLPSTQALLASPPLFPAVTLIGHG
jgi:hypothetical protein